MDPVTGRWNPAEAMAIRRSRVGVAVLRNNLYGHIKHPILSKHVLKYLVLAIGGYNGVERLNTVEVLDGSKKAWSRVGSMNCRRSAVGAAALNDHLYVIRLKQTARQHLAALFLGLWRLRWHNIIKHS